MPGKKKKRRTGGSQNRRQEGYRDSELAILQKYGGADKERERELEAKKKEILAAKQARDEQRRKAMKEAAASRVSYVKKPFAVRSRMSIILVLASMALGGAGIYEGVVTQGQAALRSGALGFCSIFLAVIALWYGVISFWEDDKNYILAKLGIGISVLLLAGWSAVIIIGLGG